MRGFQDQIYVVTMSIPAQGDDEECAVVRFITEQPPETDQLLKYASQFGGTIEVNAERVDVSAGTGLVDMCLWIKSTAESVDVDNSDITTPETIRMNELERAQRNLQRQVLEIGEGVKAIVAALAVRAPVEPAGRAGGYADDQRYQSFPGDPPRSNADHEAQIAQPTGRRDRVGATPEMSSGKMSLVGPAPTSTILEVGIGRDGQPGIVEGRLGTVGTTLTHGTR